MSQRDHGLEGVVLTQTRLSKVDGLGGKLTIAGFPLEELAPNASFEETLYLLWHGRLPLRNQLDELKTDLATQRDLPAATMDILRRCADRGIPPMEALRLGVDSLCLADDDPTRGGREANLRRARSLAARMPTIIGAYARMAKGREVGDPRADLGHAAHFLYQYTGEEPGAEAVRALNTYLNAVVDHGMNASTFTARVIVSTRSDLISAVVGAIGALKGPLHGGAPGPALDTVFMLRRQAANEGVPLEQIAESWAQDTVASGERIMGFGHRVYKVHDPRAEVLGAAAAQLFEREGDLQLYEDARTVERALLRVLEEMKPGRRIRTNVEFYTALLLYGLRLDASHFSSVFAMARVGGWTAHILEQIEQDVLIRPRAEYVGELDRAWVPIDERD